MNDECQQNPFLVVRGRIALILGSLRWWRTGILKPVQILHVALVNRLRLRHSAHCTILFDCRKNELFWPIGGDIDSFFKRQSRSLALDVIFYSFCCRTKSRRTVRLRENANRFRVTSRPQSRARQVAIARFIHQHHTITVPVPHERAMIDMRNEW